VAAFVVASCSDVSGPPSNTLTTDQLLVLDLQSTAPPVSSVTKWISNQSGGTILLTHADGNLTVYAEVDFPPNALSSVNGQRLTTTDSVLINVTPRTDGYGITISPSGLEFTLSDIPTVTFSFARYADPSAGASDPTYGDVNAYVNALDVWFETSVDAWNRANGSGSVGADEISAGVDQPGTFVIAAPR
jgi:hypothetical protein